LIRDPLTELANTTYTRQRRQDQGARCPDSRIMASDGIECRILIQNEQLEQVYL